MKEPERPDDGVAPVPLDGFRGSKAGFHFESFLVIECLQQRADLRETVQDGPIGSAYIAEGKS